MTSRDEVFREKLGIPAWPPASQLMGTEVLDFDEDQGTIRIRYDPDPGFRSLVGNIHGGFLAAFLDECMGYAGIVASAFARLCPTVEIKTSFLRPAPMGPVIGEGRTIRMGRTTAFLEGRLSTEKGKLIATGSATGVPMDIPEDWSKILKG